MIEVGEGVFGTSCSPNVHTFIFVHILFQTPVLKPMAVWDIVCTWRRSLISLARGLCACLLAVLYLFLGFVLCSGRRAAQTASPSHLQSPLGEESAGSLSSSIPEEGSSAIPETTHAGFDAPFNVRCHPRFANGQPLVPNPQESVRPMIIPKIVVQDFSTEDGSVRYKTTDYDLARALKRGRHFSWAYAPTTLGDHLPVNTRQSSLGLPPSVGCVRTKPSGRKRAVGDVVAKDGSFVIVGL